MTKRQFILYCIIFVAVACTILNINDSENVEVNIDGDVKLKTENDSLK